MSKINVKSDAPDLFEKWNKLYTKGDVAEIKKKMSENHAVTDESIRKQFRDGQYSNLEILKAVSAYYEDKEASVKKILKG